MKKHAITLLAMIVLPACAVELGSGNGKADSRAILATITAEIGDAACDDSSQCRTLPVGAKACGGPEAYLAWSSQRGKEKTLLTLSDAHQTARRAEQGKSGMASNCAMVVDPGARCVRPDAARSAKPPAGRCTLNNEQNTSSAESTR